MSDRPSTPSPPAPHDPDATSSETADRLEVRVPDADLGTPAPVVSEAPTELALELSPATPHAEPTLQLKRATLVAEGDDADPETTASLRRAENYVGFIIDGRYHIQELIAHGGMGVVYRGRHRLIDKAVAIKILRPELADNREITQRFLTEAQAASSIGNEHIVDITDFGELPDGATYIVMEYLEGEALSRRVGNDRLLSPRDVLVVARQAAEGLQSAHDAGIVHRDLKPDNIFLTHRGKDELFVKILDFGIAKVASSQNQVTRAGRIFGTPHYMSPEQGRGEELDNRSDIYSMGVILYELLSGSVPFDGENPLGILTQHMYTEPKTLHLVCAPGRVDAGLEAVVAKCLMKEPWQRYNSMADFDRDLELVQLGQVPKAVDEMRRLKSSPSSLRRRLDATRRGSWRLWVTLTALALLSVGVVASDRVPGVGWSELRPKLELGYERVTQWATSTTEEPQTTGDIDVALVLSPIDARVFHGTDDYGVMPITVRLREGQKAMLTVKRDGYLSRDVELDGTQTRLVVELDPIPGATPLPPATARVDDATATRRRVVTIPDQIPPPRPAPSVQADAGPKRRTPRTPPTRPDAGARPPERRTPAPDPVPFPPNPPSDDVEEPIFEAPPPLLETLPRVPEP